MPKSVCLNFTVVTPLFLTVINSHSVSFERSRQSFWGDYWEVDGSRLQSYLQEGQEGRPGELQAFQS